MTPRRRRKMKNHEGTRKIVLRELQNRKRALNRIARKGGLLGRRRNSAPKVARPRCRSRRIAREDRTTTEARTLNRNVYSIQNKLDGR